MQSDLIDRLAVVLTDSEVARITEVRKSLPPVVPPVIPPKWIPGITKLQSGRWHEYSTMYPGDKNHRWILTQHLDGFLDVVQTDGKVIRTLPATINTSSQPRWSRTNPDVFYFSYLNELRKYDALKDQITTVFKFANMTNINGRGESDISEDDDHMIFADGQHVFVFQLSSKQIVTEFDAPSAFDNLYLTPANEPVIGIYDTGTFVYSNGTLRNLTPSIGHMDVSSDKFGKSIIVRTNSADTKGVPQGCNNGIELLEIETGTRRCLLPLDWAIAVHISLPDRATFALVSTYVPGNPISNIKYANEILKVNFDGTVNTITKHGAGSTPYTYEGTPRASISHDGTHFVYDSKGDVYLGIL